MSKPSGISIRYVEKGAGSFIVLNFFLWNIYIFYLSDRRASVVMSTNSVGWLAHVDRLKGGCFITKAAAHAQGFTTTLETLYKHILGKKNPTWLKTGVGFYWIWWPRSPWEKRRTREHGVDPLRYRGARPTRIILKWMDQESLVVASAAERVEISVPEWIRRAHVQSIYEERQREREREGRCWLALLSQRDR